jgi:hypothetical protein
MVDREDRMVRAWEGHKDVLLPVSKLRVPGRTTSRMRSRHRRDAAVPGEGEGPGEGARGVPGLAHRLEPLGTLEGVAFYNDSKATNVDSMRTALAAFPGPLVVIAGGRDKKGDWAALEALRERSHRPAGADRRGGRHDRAGVEARAARPGRRPRRRGRQGAGGGQELGGARSC